METILDRNLIVLKNKIVEMAILCEQALIKATQALNENNLILAQKIINDDEIINDMEKEILTLCYSLLVRQQPVASDFKFISASLKIATDLERIGDYTTDISEIVLESLSSNFILKNHLLTMSDHVLKMLKDSIQSLLNLDKQLAVSIIKYDDYVDDDLKQLKSRIVDDMIIENDKRSFMLDTFMIAKYFERCGDRCVNIANSVIFLTK